MFGGKYPCLLCVNRNLRRFVRVLFHAAILTCEGVNLERFLLSFLTATAGRNQRVARTAARVVAAHSTYNRAKGPATDGFDSPAFRYFDLASSRLPV